MAWELDIVLPNSTCSTHASFGDVATVWHKIAAEFPRSASIGHERHWHTDGCLFRASLFSGIERAENMHVDAIALTVSGTGNPLRCLMALCRAFGAIAFDVYDNASIDLHSGVLPGWTRYRARTKPDLRAVPSALALG